MPRGLQDCYSDAYMRRADGVVLSIEPGATRAVVLASLGLVNDA